MLIVGSKNSLPSQVSFDEQQLVSLLSNIFDGKKAKELYPLPYSSSNKTLILTFDDNSNIVVKVSVRESRFDRISMEANLIKQLSKKTKLPLPQVLHTDFSRNDFQYPFVVYSYVKGINLVDAIKKIKNKKIIGTELANIANQIHQIEYMYPQFSLAKSPISKNWKSLIQEACNLGLTALDSHGYKNIIALEKYVHTKMKLIEEPRSYRLIHRDLQPQNIHWDLYLNRINGVFDFEAAMSGDYLFEFAYLETRLFKEHPEIRDSFYETYSRYNPLRSNYKEIVKFYEVVRDLIFFERDISYNELDRAKIALESLERIALED
ncbi:MAG: hypothetical protein US95_C0003G0018 [Candidatus Woesebacteria bacterium GW2011_GWB1_38_5]|uniref:Aminoglycoside phosphotransferase domain-containing protein n=4 Tax=Candidatus Woeseibacteriota TaxID=1752722 RepID=A0A0G0L8L2_9BACT|nr:MAG: hypothetical protein US67_C0020G0002 [Candidatus Woesebacteria bacterium GW2011_GWD1_38_10]KKQ55524.1 MAG: hypothetical protein US75_C0019G0006 [Candidatus Woesebacteria bacterium GW2011_GWC1_38_13]KKQ75215.1 MAG: hypothetical protein US97_C0044G0002 [Microgenomates group bacterium GW2011_GWF1_38_5]KKQ75466.1 MAG: hypothetical protein US95_C0003G0018 [Candidatus Woesebacteria bacterium GW2011_GWB1_38_5]KKQ84185.1 MAG: hypothetical protein UT06_C0008G0009 [Candidatus Woesebacteria bacter